MSDGDVSAVEVRILAVMVEESSGSGFMSGERLNRGITGVESVDLHNGYGKLVARGLVLAYGNNDHKISNDGWEWIGRNRDAVKAAQGEE